jgi:hypothetical protein
VLSKIVTRRDDISQNSLPSTIKINNFSPKVRYYREKQIIDNKAEDVWEVFEGFLKELKRGSL